MFASITKLGDGRFFPQITQPYENKKIPYIKEYITAIDPLDPSSPAIDSCANDSYIKINKSIALLLSKIKSTDGEQLNHKISYIDNICNAPLLSIDQIKSHFDSPVVVKLNGQIV